ncbi:MAG: Triphosphoribosyl-dephospho-CoA synthase (EC [uncultured Paraburkholderia sp.]|uniref:triphosphoribosyl-dephospho-CoA synthase n=1 Tax=uncultured Paraburkholderia sp. TaxID=1822466 RepID=UPI0025936A80|nr:triphosphoribosyl-dephospho-CoA synthase [uncultured Paraburkholderia sp.]CAH2900491.1 MAG: Triphosphoribosyl-dephospho-CoA synthase (EC [uncultured Paraburkholderia sp.]CAH2928915.1 MAG: Triphosphoribosyl-dephospho-CoA synthase (EC [uncultured Paraburkholderia sp.]
MRAAAVLFERDERSPAQAAQAAQAVQVGPAQLPAARVSKSFQNLFTDAELAHYAVTALIDEAELTPKPALVDRRGSGAHRDLDLAIMRRSAHALEPTFDALASTARRRGEPSALLRTELAQIGRAGEQDMLRATGGSNAHRGAIWIVGLLVAGASLQQTAGRLDASNICQRAAQIACFPDRFAAATDSHGERVRQRYQVGGARREAQEGFPHVIGTGLPALIAARERGIAEDAARVDGLLSIMASLDDTCLLHRAGLDGLHAGQRGAQRVLQAGGSSTREGQIALAALEQQLLSLNASPGGAADLLAATLFLDMLAHHDASGS